jgi:anti-anti-sigma factor
MATLHIDDYLDLDVDAGDGAAPPVVRVVGELDVAGCPAAREAVEALLDDKTAVVLDLSGVTFFSAAGISLVLALDDRARAQGTDLIVRDPHPVVMRLFRLAGVVDHLRFEQSCPADGA